MAVIKKTKQNKINFGKDVLEKKILPTVGGNVN
jgi:hypothetical protein